MRGVQSVQSVQGAGSKGAAQGVQSVQGAGSKGEAQGVQSVQGAGSKGEAQGVQSVQSVEEYRGYWNDQSSFSTIFRLSLRIMPFLRTGFQISPIFSSRPAMFRIVNISGLRSSLTSSQSTGADTVA